MRKWEKNIQLLVNKEPLIIDKDLWYYFETYYIPWGE